MTTSAGRIFYFAYGSNMAPERLQARVPSARKLGVALLRGYRLKFHKSGKDGSAKCDASRTDDVNDQVHGVLYSMLESELAVLDGYEGRGHGYERQTATVERAPGEIVDVEIYVATHLDESMHPFDWYIEHVLRGADSAVLPDAYVATIRAVTVIADPDTERSARELSIYRSRKP
jgi:gamma-glutamylcyclotransferase (GGCT)/AIG2-like uncharacterized protein YtfP